MVVAESLQGIVTLVHEYDPIQDGKIFTNPCGSSGYRQGGSWRAWCTARLSRDKRYIFTSVQNQYWLTQQACITYLEAKWALRGQNNMPKSMFLVDWVGGKDS